MGSLDCNGWIVTINHEPRWAEQSIAEPSPAAKPRRNPRNRMTHAQWVAYLRACDKVKRNEPEDMAPQGMVPFGRY